MIIWILFRLSLGLKLIKKVIDISIKELLLIPPYHNDPPSDTESKHHNVTRYCISRSHSAIVTCVESHDDV